MVNKGTKSEKCVKKAIKKSQPEKLLQITKSEKKYLPIVGIGASAGGLEALEQFFMFMPANTGISIVIITHLDRTHASIMPELIKKYTKMPVFSIKEGMKAEPNTVYVIPPNANIQVKNNILHLSKQEKSHHENLPINYFFESLAQEKKEHAIGIILSGSGSDGTLGLKAIKSEGGIAIVQDPLTAKYDGMPQSAVNSGLVDYVVPVEKIPDQIIACLRHDGSQEKKISPELQEIFMILKAHTGHDFSSYKFNTLYRRIEKQMYVHHINKTSDYVKFLRTHPQEINTLFKDILIGVTRFFRDKEAFEILKRNVLAKLFKNKPDDYCIRVWIPGCSSGEEVYSIAIIIRECFDEMKRYYTVQIFGTDIDLIALEIARAGVYSDAIANEIEPERLKRFFIKEKKLYRVKKEIREMVVFGVQNIIKDPPFTKLDLICCRNLLIYFNPQLQKRLLPIFHYSLKPKGILFLGTSEAIVGYDEFFRLIFKKWKIFERKENISYIYSGYNFSNFPRISDAGHVGVPDLNRSGERMEIDVAIRSFLINNYVPSCALINKKGDIIYSHGKVNRYFDLDEKKRPINLFDIVPSKIKNKLSVAIRKAIAQHKTIRYQKFLPEKTKNVSFNITLKISPVLEPNAMRGLVFIVFEESAGSKFKASLKEKYGTPAKMSKRIIKLEEELQFTKEDLQSTIEELQSSNEELQSTNEELQSTNEEIETSKEELQSLNEELVTVNTELQNKIDQLASINDDMSNLFNSTEIAAIFLDSKLCIKLFTPKTQDVIHIIKSDIGRPLQHLAMNIKYENLIADAQEVLKSLQPKQIETIDKNKNYYLIRILPYRTLSNVIDGVIIIFDDITQHKLSESKLSELNTALNDSVIYTKSILDAISQPMLVLSENFRVILANRSYYHFFQTQPENTLNQSFYSLGKQQWNIPDLRTKLEAVTKTDAAHNKFVTEQDFPVIGHKKLMLNAFRIFRDELETNTILLIMEEMNHANSP